MLAELFVRHAEELCVFLRNRRGRNDAEDLVQVSFARLIENKREQMVGNQCAWLYSTSANLAADAYDYQRVRSGLHVEWAAAEQVEAGYGQACSPIASASGRTRTFSFSA